MQERQKWNVVRKNLKPEDIVLIMDETSPRNSWLMGRIIETMPDSRGHVRPVIKLARRFSKGAFETTVFEIIIQFSKC